MTNQPTQTPDKAAHRSPIFALADEYITEAAKFSPMESTALGIPGLDDQLDDFSLAHAEKAIAYDRQVLAQVKALAPIDEIDRVAQSVMVERMEARLKLHDTKESYRTYGMIASPVSGIRSIFAIMNKDGAEGVKNVTARLNAVGNSLQSWKSCLEDIDKLGLKTSRRQVLNIAQQLHDHGTGGYTGVAKSLDATNADLLAAAKSAEAACLEMSAWMKDVHAPRSAAEDNVGAERYAPWARYFTGADLDLMATYEWGKANLDEINKRMWVAAAKVTPTAKTLAEVQDQLENSDNHAIHGSDNLIKALKDFTEAAIKQVEGKYFDIDPRIRECDARLAPEGSAAAPYYMGPTEDLSRPGITWYPTLGKDRFNFWHIASTWYHEAVPGHHLQVATATIERDRLSRFQRSAAWISGYGEGWALYAERFMDELGAFEDPAYELGYCSAQALRAARIVVDIGMHLGLPNFDGGTWDAESAYNLLVERAMMDPDFARSEVDRYLSWPGQAISYKVGEKYWLDIREETKARLGSDWDIKKFHSHALKIGPMGLDALKAEMANFSG